MKYQGDPTGDGKVDYGLEDEQDPRQSGAQRIPDSPPLIDQGLEGIPSDDVKLFTHTLKQTVLEQKLKNYRWSTSLLQNVVYFPDLQDPTPLDPADRDAIVQGTPNLSSAAPCESLEGFGEQYFRLDEKDYWFASKAVPRLHRNIYQEISTLAFVLQEANPTTDDGSRIGLQEDQLLGLLSKVIRLKIDTLSLLADYQIERCRRATRRPPRKIQKDSTKKAIFSEKMLAEDDKKLEKSRKDAKNWGFTSMRQRNYRGGGGGTRRHRGTQAPFNFGGQPTTQNSYPSPARKRGYGEQNQKPKFSVTLPPSFSGQKGNDVREFKFTGGFNKRRGNSGRFQQKKFQRQRGSVRRF